MPLRKDMAIFGLFAITDPIVEVPSNLIITTLEVRTRVNHILPASPISMLDIGL